MGVVIAIIFISIAIPLIYKKDINNAESEDKIIFEFNNFSRRIMLIGTIMSICLTCIFLITTIVGEEKNFAGPILFSIFPLFTSIMYIILKNRKIIYQNNEFFIYNMWRKKREISIQDLAKAVEFPTKGMELTFKNNYKLKIYAMMNNYSKIKNILVENNIQYTDVNGNINKKGW